MTEFLVRKFVKDYKNIEDSKVRTSYGILSSIVGIFCNVLLFSIKLIVGLILGSIAVMADAFNNLSDAASSIISFIGVKMAERPADKRHPFGHGRIEYIAAFVVACLVIQVGLSFLKSSIVKFGHPSVIRVEWFAFWILVLSLGVKAWMAVFNKKLGKRIDSKVMLAAAADSMGDMITTGATILSIIIYYYFHMNIDAVAGLVVSVLVIGAGIDIAKETLEPLIGEPADPELVEQIQKKIQSFPQVTGSHELIIHDYGPGKRMASVHVEMSKDMDVELSHGIIDTIEREILKELDVFMVIHMDPVDLKDSRTQKVKEQLEHVVNEVDSSITFHDLSVSWEQQKIILEFDILVPHGYEKEKQETIKQIINEKMKKIDDRYGCVIAIDKSYVGQND